MTRKESLYMFKTDTVIMGCIHSICQQQCGFFFLECFWSMVGCIHKCGTRRCDCTWISLISCRLFLIVPRLACYFINLPIRWSVQCSCLGLWKANYAFLKSTRFWSANPVTWHQVWIILMTLDSIRCKPGTDPSPETYRTLLIENLRAGHPRR